MTSDARQLREQVEAAIACAERDCSVNPQFAGGLQPIIAILRDALLCPVGEEGPQEKRIKYLEKCLFDAGVEIDRSW